MCHNNCILNFQTIYFLICVIYAIHCAVNNTVFEFFFSFYAETVSFLPFLHVLSLISTKPFFLSLLIIFEHKQASEAFK